jgi:hypothetical protein
LLEERKCKQPSKQAGMQAGRQIVAMRVRATSTIEQCEVRQQSDREEREMREREKPNWYGVFSRFAKP